MEVKATQVLTGHIGAIYDVLVNKQTACFTTSADKHTVKWDLKAGQQDAFTIKLPYSGFRVALNNEDEILAIGTSKGGIHIVDLTEKMEIRYLTQHQVPVFSLSYNTFTNEFYSGDAAGYFCVWSGKNVDLKLTLPFNCGKLRQISINETGSHIALCGQDGFIRILETNFFNIVSEFKTHNTGVNCAIFKGETIFTGGKNAHIALWNWKTGEQLKQITAHNYAVYDFVFLNNQQLLVSASFDKSIKIWDTENFSILKRLERKDGGHSHVVNRLAKISDNSFLSVGDDRQIICWEVY
jgi:WD40 repeat protein